MATSAPSHSFSPVRLLCRACLVVWTGIAGVLVASEHGLCQETDPPASLESAADRASATLARLAEQGAGLSVAVGWRGDVVWARGFGYAEIDSGQPMTADTRSRVYSVSKGFTAAAAARLVERGRLDPDASVRDYVPEFPEKADTITPMHLLTHSSGIRHYRDSAEARSDRHCETVSEAITMFADDPLVHRPGEGRTYSSWGYVLMSQVISRAAERPFARMLQEHVFEPAGMDSTALDDPDRDLARAATYRVSGDGTVARAPSWDVTCKWGAGGYLSTAPDLVRFQQAIVNGELLSPPMVKRLVHARADTSPAGRPVWALSGWSGDAMAFVRTDLETGLTLALLSNAIGEQYGPRVQKAVGELHRQFVEAAEAGASTVNGG